MSYWIATIDCLLKWIFWLAVRFASRIQIDGGGISTIVLCPERNLKIVNKLSGNTCNGKVLKMRKSRVFIFSLMVFTIGCAQIPDKSLTMKGVPKFFKVEAFGDKLIVRVDGHDGSRYRATHDRCGVYESIELGRLVRARICWILAIDCSLVDTGKRQINQYFRQSLVSIR